METTEARGESGGIDYRKVSKGEAKLVFRDHLAGQVANLAIRQSPYDCPEGLGNVVAEFSEALRPSFDEHGLAKLTMGEIESMLNEKLLPLSQVQDWNERKNGRDGYGIVTRFSKPEPDDDFIDLDALVKNVAHATYIEAALGL